MTDEAKLYRLTGDDVSDIISVSKEFASLSEHIEDPDLDRAMMYMAKFIEDPTMTSASAQWAIVHLEALASSFGMKSVNYKTYGKGGVDERYRKDVYYTARDAIRHLVDALKYVIRAREAG